MPRRASHQDRTPMAGRVHSWAIVAQLAPVSKGKAGVLTQKKLLPKGNTLHQ